MLAAGENITTGFDITSVGGFEGIVNFSFYGPLEIENASSISPTSVNLTSGETESINLTLGAEAQTPAGTYWCRIEGISGEIYHKLFLTVNIGAAGQPLLMASPTMVAIGGPPRRDIVQAGRGTGGRFARAAGDRYNRPGDRDGTDPCGTLHDGKRQRRKGPVARP